MDIDEFKNYLKALPEKILSTAPAIVSETAVEYYKERFAVKGFDGSPWIPGRPKKSKANQKKADAGDAPGTVKAHTRHMNIPKRQFMGYSRDMADRIKKRLDEAIDGIL